MLVVYFRIQSQLFAWFQIKSFGVWIPCD